MDQLPHPVPVPEEPAPEIERDEHGRIKHPVCEHWEYEDRIEPGGPCKDCIKAIEREYASRQPHPHCGCLKPAWSHRTDGGPCGQCLKDVEREYGLLPDPRINDDAPSLEDIRTWRAPKLVATDWVDTNPGRVSREPEGYVLALREYRQQLFDITNNYAGNLVWPAEPNRDQYINQPEGN